MGPLLRLFAWRHARRQPLRVLLACTSIALGVALLVAIECAHATVVSSLEATADQLSGSARFEVARTGHLQVDEAALPSIREVPGAIATPVVQGTVLGKEPRAGSLLLLGVDFRSDPRVRAYATEGNVELSPLVVELARGRAAMVPKRFADKFGLAIGSWIEVETRTGTTNLPIAAILRDEGPARVFGGNLVIVDVANARSILGREPRGFDRIEVAPDGITADELRARLAIALKDGYEIRDLRRRPAVVENVLVPLRSLISISAMALVVALFLVTNTVALSVTERTREIGILRALGARRHDVTIALLAEWTALGLVGSAAGVALGHLLARFLTEQTARSVNRLVLAVDVRPVALSIEASIAGIAAGTLTAAVAALLPALTAARTDPVASIREGATSGIRQDRTRRSFVAGAVLVGASVAAMALGASSLPAFAWLGLAISTFVGLTLCAPRGAVAFAALVRPILRLVLPAEGWLAADDVVRHPQRTALTSIAFGGAIAVMVGSASIVRSFESATETWMADSFPFDFSVQANDLATSIYGPSAHPESVLETVRRVPGVAMSFGARAVLQPWRGTEVLLVAVDLEGYFAMHRSRGRASPFSAADTPELLASMRRGDAVLVSRNWPRLHGADVGDSIELATRRGPHRFRVAAVVDDLSWPNGVVILHRDAYRELWGDPTLSFTDVRLADGASAADVKAHIGEALRGTTHFVYEVADLQVVARDAINAMTALANVQVLTAVVVGFLGIVNTLLISVLQRRREIGCLRAIGATRRQVRRCVAAESVVLAVAGGAFGVVAGLVGAAIPLRQFTLKLTGYYVPFEIPWTTLALAAATALLLGLAASWLPARRASRVSVIEAIAWE